jgi:hypothetical protein
MTLTKKCENELKQHKNSRDRDRNRKKQEHCQKSIKINLTNLKTITAQKQQKENQ